MREEPEFRAPGGFWEVKKQRLGFFRDQGRSRGRSWGRRD